jgi:transketolase
MIDKGMKLADIGKPEMVPARDGYGKALVELGEENKDVVVLTGDLSESTRVQWFQEKFPDRFFEVGVAEQNMVGLAAGLALNGKIPFVSSYAVFCPGRAWDQTRVSVCYTRANVKIAGAHAGISVGPDGATHQALEDVASIRVLPNIVVIVPCDWQEARKATKAAAAIKGPVYFRFGREKVPTITTDKTPFTVGKAEVYREGEDVAIVACGAMVYEALIAAQLLEKEGIDAMVINNHTIKPIDKETLTQAARRCGAMVTAEEHQINGGMGSAVMEVIAESFPVPIERVGMKDTFGESGKPSELLVKYGMTSKEIVQAARSVVRRKFAYVQEFGPAICPQPVGMTPERAEQILSPVPPHVTFKVANGEKVDSLQGLHHVLLAMDKETFSRHVNNGRNDFAQWVQDVHKDVELAAVMRRHASKASLARALGVRIAQLYEKKGGK